MTTPLKSYVVGALQSAVTASDLFEAVVDKDTVTRSILLGSYLHQESPDLGAEPTKQLLFDYRSQYGKPGDNPLLQDLMQVHPEIKALERALQASPAKRTGRIRKERSPFKISDTKYLASGPKTKAHNNLEAIRLLKVLESTKKDPTAAEQFILSRYLGWGGLKDVFSPGDDDGWNDISTQLKQILSNEEHEACKAGILNAHYTAPNVINAVWKGVEHLGFKGGKVLEPGCGILYYLGLQPTHLRKKSQWAGIELDSIPARIARYLYPEAEIYNTGFEALEFAEDSFDLVIGNVPFGSYAPFDPKYAKHKFNIHNLFIAKSADSLRAGGLLVLITSTGTLTTEPKLLKYLEDKVNFLGAIRLPSSAFKQNANTQVTTDIVILQKCGNGIDSIPNNWNKIVDYEGVDPSPVTGKYPQINRYFLKNPDMVLGRLTLDSLFNTRLGVEPDDDETPLGDRIVTAFKSLPGDVYIEGKTTTFKRIPEDLVGEKPYSFVEYNGKIVQILQYTIEEVSPSVEPRIRAYIDIRHALKQLLWYQRHGCGDGTLAWAQKRLNDLYDRYVFTLKYGSLNKRANINIFGDDPDSYLVRALEHWDGKVATKSDIFTHRTFNYEPSPQSASDPSSALIISLNEKGCVDLNYMSKLLGGLEPQSIALDLHAAGLLYFDPQKALDGIDTLNAWTTQDEYLSGDVRLKLAQARLAIERRDLDQEYYFPIQDWEWETLRANVKALELIQPKFLLPPATATIKAGVVERLGADRCDLDPKATIELRMGSPCIAPSDVAEFAAFLLERSPSEVSVTYEPAIASWGVSGGYSAITSQQNTVTHGTAKRSALELIEHGLNRKDPVVYDYDPEGHRTVNQTQTEAARDKLMKIRERFKTWLWEDPERAYCITEKYNKEFNCYVSRQYDGRHLTLPGSNPEVKLRDVQANGIWRGVQSPTTLLGWEMGLGKTMCLAGIAMELKRLGLANKPMIAVMNSTLPQVVAEFRKLYPHANLLVPGENDFKRENRRKLLTIMATNRWDCIILPHSQLFSMTMSKETVGGFLRLQIEEYEQLLQMRSAQSGGEDSEKRITTKLENEKKRLVAKLYKVLNSPVKDGVINFEDTGIDALLLDESQVVKNMPIATQMRNVMGIPTTYSNRAQDAFMKIMWLRGQNRKVVFSTGTPISNTVAELFILQRYLQLDKLKELGIHLFDAWAGLFGEVVTAPEITPDGRYKVRSRFARFTNIPELMEIFQLFADLQIVDESKIERPELMQESSAAEASPQQVEHMAELLARAEAIAQRRVEPEEDNMLALTTAGRKGSMDIRLVRPDGENWATSKINQLVIDTYNVWRLTAAQKTAQAIFCDFSTPKKPGKSDAYDELCAEALALGLTIEAIALIPKPERKFTAYNYIVDALVALGVPREEIAMIHDYETSVKRSKLYDAVNDGRIRIILGSTQRLGTGTNIQKRLILMTHLDAPWRPGDLSQRTKRGHRSGNKNTKVWNVYYVTEGIAGQAGFDAFLWQKLATKAEFIAQIMSRKIGFRQAEDIDPEVLTLNHIKAIATGDVRFKEKADVDAKVGQLTRLRSAHEDEMFRIKCQLSDLVRSIDRMTDLIPQLNADLKTVQANPFDGDSFSMKIGKKVYTKRKQAGERLLDIASGLRAKVLKSNSKVGWSPVGTFAGLDMEISADTGYRKDDVEVSIRLVGTQNYFISIHPRDAVALGLIQSIENHLRRLPERIGQAKMSLENDKERFKQVSGTDDQPFDREDELQETLARQAELDAIFEAVAEAAAVEESSSAQEKEPPSSEDVPEQSQEDTDRDLVDALADMGSKNTASYDGTIESEVIEILRNSDIPDWIRALEAEVLSNPKMQLAEPQLV